MLPPEELIPIVYNTHKVDGMIPEEGLPKVPGQDLKNSTFADLLEVNTNADRKSGVITVNTRNSKPFREMHSRLVTGLIKENFGKVLQTENARISRQTSAMLLNDDPTALPAIQEDPLGESEDKKQSAMKTNHPAA